MKKILIISFTDLKRDVRVNRTIRFLNGEYDVSTVGLIDPGIDAVKFYPIEKPLVSYIGKVKRCMLYGFGMFEESYWLSCKFEAICTVLTKQKFDLIIANEIESLPFAVKISNGSKIIFDAHEYSPREFEDSILWKFFVQPYIEYLCAKYLKYCDRMITVCDSIAEEYHRNYGIEPAVINNACSFRNIQPSPVEERHIKLIHHGVAAPSRRIEQMIKMTDYLDERFSLDLMLVPLSGYGNYLKELKKISGNFKRVKFLEPVSSSEIVDFINNYDIGFYLLPPSNFNNKFALPNKFFEFIQARLAIAIGPSPEMARIVRKYNCGIVSESFEPKLLAKNLNYLDKQKIEYYKKQSAKAAFELSQENNFLKLKKIIEALVNY